MVIETHAPNIRDFFYCTCGKYMALGKHIVYIGVVGVCQTELHGAYKNVSLL